MATKKEIEQITSDKEVQSLINDKTIISSHNVIPSGRQVNRKDIDSFVKKIKDKKGAE